MSQSESGDQNSSPPSLDLAFFSLSVFVEHWFIMDRDYRDFMVQLRKEFAFNPDGPLPLTPEARAELERKTRLRERLRQRIQENSTRVLIFGDRQGLDMTPLLRFMRAVEDRCEFNVVDEQAVLDCFERAHLRHVGMRASEDDLPGDLSETQRRAYSLILKEGPLLGKTIATKLGVEWGTLKRHILPPLRTLGLKNSKGRGGYFVER